MDGKGQLPKTRRHPACGTALYLLNSLADSPTRYARPDHVFTLIPKTPTARHAFPPSGLSDVTLLFPAQSLFGPSPVFLLMFFLIVFLAGAPFLISTSPFRDSLPNVPKKADLKGWRPES